MDVFLCFTLITIHNNKRKLTITWEKKTTIGGGGGGIRYGISESLHVIIFKLSDVRELPNCHMQLKLKF